MHARQRPSKPRRKLHRPPRESRAGRRAKISLTHQPRYSMLAAGFARFTLIQEAKDRRAWLLARTSLTYVKHLPPKIRPTRSQYQRSAHR